MLNYSVAELRNNKWLNFCFYICYKVSPLLTKAQKIRRKMSFISIFICTFASIINIISLNLRIKDEEEFKDSLYLRAGRL